MNIANHIALINTIKHYSIDKARADLIAALTVTIMLIPQSLAYAMLAGLPPEIGLYSSILPLVFYALLGSSASLAVGPVAVISLMTATTIADVSQHTDFTAIEIAIHLALLSGALLILSGWLRFGFLVNFISHSVTEGFILASVILIIASQLKHLLGLDVSGSGLAETLTELFSHITSAHIPTLLFSICAIACLCAGPKILSRYLQSLGISQQRVQFLVKLIPSSLVIISLGLMHIPYFTTSNIQTIGYIPSALPELGIFSFQPELMHELFLPALLISLIGYIESISVATKFASKTRSRVNANAELTALGAANISSAFSGGMPVTGGFSRSVVNFSAGAKTTLSGVFAALFLTVLASGVVSYLQLLPKAMLAATIVVAVIGLFDISKVISTWRFSTQDFLLLAITFLLTLLAGVEAGVSTGVVVSILMHLYHTSKPHIAIIGQVAGTEHFRNVCRHDVKTIPEILGLRVDERLYFANAAYLKNYILTLVTQSDQIEHCILQCSSVSDLDSSALESLDELFHQLQEMGISLHLTEVKGPVMDKLKNSDFYQQIKNNIHLTHFQAINTLSVQYAEYQEESDVYQVH